jgi:hypothetical protein
MDVNATVNSLNNSALAAQSTRLNPVMTSNTTPSGVVMASIMGSTNPWQAFDANTSSDWTPSATPTQWIQYQFTSAVTIRSYSIFYRGGIAGYPTNFNLQGSNDGISFTTLDTRTGFVYTTGQYNTLTIAAPYSAYSYYRLNITAVNAGNLQLPELTFNEAGASIAAGGSFNFNTAGVTVTCTSTSASLSAGATNLITVTATTGTVTLNLGSSVTGLSTATTQIFNYTGNCNFTLSGITFTGGSAASAFCINKSSTGTINITGSFVGGSNATGHVISSSAGNTVVLGNITAASGAGISQTAGNITVTGNIAAAGSAAIGLTGAASILTVTGNIVGGTATNAYGVNLTGAASQFTINGNVTGGSATTAHGINFTGASGVVTGNVIGGTSTGNGINTSGAVTVNGNVFGAATFGINTGSAITLTINGDVYASATASGISSTNANGVVNLTGNMYNGLGRNAIYCQNVFISNTATTLWRVDTGGGDYKFLYSADTTPNLPATTNVRSGVTFGPALSLTGTMVVPAASDVRENVPVDNSVGTAELTSADIISGINASSDPLAVRLKNALTDVTAGNIISQYKDS